MENFLEDWNYSCTSVLSWKRYYVLKLWNVVGGRSDLCLPKIQECLKWLYLGQQGSGSQVPSSPAVQRTQEQDFAKDSKLIPTGQELVSLANLI